MKSIQISRGYVAIVDDEDYERLSRYRWYATPRVGKNGITGAYAVTNVYNKQLHKQRTISMHRMLMGEPSGGAVVDHIDGDGLNNRRGNLRLGSLTDNMANRRKLAPATSRYRGVTWKKKNRNWIAQICRDKRVQHIGSFRYEVAAAAAYNARAHRLYGEFALLNKLSV